MRLFSDGSLLVSILQQLTAGQDCGVQLSNAIENCGIKEHRRLREAMRAGDWR